MTVKSPKTSSPRTQPKLAWDALSGIDIITLIYTAWIMFYMAIGWSRAANPLIHFPRYLAIFVLVIVFAYVHKKVSKHPSSQLSQALIFIRSIYPISLFGYFFVGGYVVNRIIFACWQDPLFYKLDKLIFGYSPSLVWGKTFAHPLIDEFFAFAYFSYYPMIVGLPILLWFKDRKAFHHCIFCLTFVFYLCYFIYSWLPVIGGRYFSEAMELSKQSNGYLFSAIMAFIYQNSHHLGGAFPSSHVAIALTLSIAAWQYRKSLGTIMLALTFFLSIATVYCHYHWFVDAIAGILMGLVGYLTAAYVYKFLPRISDE